MDKLLATLRTYFIPLLLLGVALLTLSSDPKTPILKSVPIIPGPYQHEIATVFAVAGLLLALLIRRHKKRKAGPSR